MPVHLFLSPLLPLLLLAGTGVGQDTYDASPHDNLRDCGRRDAAEAFCRVPLGPMAEETRARLGREETAWWVEGQTLTVAARRSGPRARLCCTIHAPMQRLGAGDLWAISIRIPEIRRAILDIAVAPGRSSGVYRGPEAPAEPPLPPELTGRLIHTSIASKHLDAVRRVTVYLPPGFESGRRYPVVYAADGAFRADDARLIERLILDREIQPIVMVAPWPGIDVRNVQLRAQEYLVGFFAGAKAFRRHQDFFLREVMPLAEREYGASSLREDRMLTGYSNGAAWAVATGLRHPRLFGHVAAFSYGWEPADAGADRRGRPRLYLSAGKLEPLFLRHTTRLAELARHAEEEVVLDTPVTGHTNSHWLPALAAALKRAFPATKERGPDGL